MTQNIEILRCGNDVSYFINKYVKIRHPIKGLIDLNTYKYQDKCLEDFEKFNFNIVLKSRQIGLSIIAAAYSVWLALFHREKNILVIATSQYAAELFFKKINFIINNLPHWLKLPKETGLAKTEISFDNGSQIKAIPSFKDISDIRGFNTYSLLIVDEAAFIRDFSNILADRIILISTQNYMSDVGEQYHRIWNDALARQNDFNPINLEFN